MKESSVTEITTEQMLAFLEDRLECPNSPLWSGEVPVYQAIRSRLSEFDSLKAEVERLYDENDRLSEQRKVDLMDLSCARGEVERLKKEAERDGQEFTRTAKSDLQSIVDLRKRAEKAEAEVERLKQTLKTEESYTNKYIERFHKAEAEVAALRKEAEEARPLLEAVEKWRDSVGWDDTADYWLIQAAGDYAAAKEPHPDEWYGEADPELENGK